MGTGEQKIDGREETKLEAKANVNLIWVLGHTYVCSLGRYIIKYICSSILRYHHLLL
jgi:hypothetical protein